MLAADVAIYGRNEDEARVRDAFRDLDVNARVRTAAYGRDSGSSWVVLASIPTRMLFENMAARGAGMASQLRELVRRITVSEDGGSVGLLMLQDTETGIQVVLAPNLPDAALQSLPGIDLLGFTFGPVHYDAGTSAWRSLFDERAPGS
jgi:hypothetical protein